MKPPIAANAAAEFPPKSLTPKFASLVAKIRRHP